MGDFLSAVGEIATNESAYRNAMVAAIILLFAALGELVAEKAGTINISLEGMMLAGAFAAAIGQDLTGSVWVGMAFAVMAGVAVAMVQSNMSHRLPADQFVVGLVLNVLVLGVVGFLAGEIDPQTNIVDRTRDPAAGRHPAARSGAVRRSRGCCTSRSRSSRSSGTSSTAAAGASRCVPSARTRTPPTCRACTSTGCGARRSTSPGSPPVSPGRCCCSRVRADSRTRSSAVAGSSPSPP